MQYELAEEPRKVGELLVKNHHSHLRNTKIVYLFQEKVDTKTGVPVMPKKKGRDLYGQAKLVTGLNAFLASGDEWTGSDGPQPFFVILITKVAWNRMSKEHKTALMDHELMHCDYDDEKETLSTRDHDVQEFHEIVKRHGVWNSDLQMFFNAAKQLPLPMVETEQQAKVVKAGAATGNGKTDDPPKSDSPSLKADVAKKRGRAAGVGR